MNFRMFVFVFAITVISVGAVATAAQAGETLSMNDCVKIALRNNTDIVAAKSNYDMAKAGLLAAYGNFTPEVSAYGQWRRRNEELIMFRFNEVVHSKDSYYYQLTLTQPLFTGFATVNTLKRDRAQARAYSHLLSWAEQQTVLRVKLQYYSVLKAKQLLKVAEETLKASQEELIRIETMERIGSISRAEVYQQKVRVGENKLALIEARNNVSSAKADLNHTLGIDVNKDFNIEEESLDVKPLEANFDELIKQAMNKRVDFQASKEGVTSAKANVRINRSGYYPQVSLNADYNWYDVEFPQRSTLTEFDNYSVSVGISMNIFNRFQTKSGVQRAKAQVISAESDMEQAKRVVTLDVKKALLELEKAAENIEVTNENLTAAEEDYRLASERYKIGAGTLLEQITAESSLTSAKANRIQALYDYKYAMAVLDVAVGNLRVVD